MERDGEFSGSEHDERTASQAAMNERRRELMIRAAALEGKLWKTVADSREDNITVIIDALATLMKRVSEYSMKAEAEETANNAEKA
jgi:hypothetical protein